MAPHHDLRQAVPAELAWEPSVTAAAAATAWVVPGATDVINNTAMS